MPIITKVSSQKKPGRYNIFLDGQYAFSASERTIAEFVLLKGQELSNEKVEAVKQFDADAKATSMASIFLSYEPRTVYEVLQYLSKHGIAEQSAQSAIRELSEMGFLDDRQYVNLVLQQNLRIGTDGPLSLARKLEQKGIDPEIIQQAFEQVDEEQWQEPGLRVLRSLKSKIGQIAQLELERKMRTKLLSHGFASDLSTAIVAQSNLQTNQVAQLAALKKQGIKAYKRFRRLNKSEREIKIRNYLYAHGFSSSEIESFLQGEIIPLDELGEY